MGLAPVFIPLFLHYEAVTVTTRTDLNHSIGFPVNPTAIIINSSYVFSHKLRLKATNIRHSSSTREDVI